MKDIKSYIIGFLTCACMFLIMGQTMSQEQIEHMKTMATQMKNAGLMTEPAGKYQGFADKGLIYLINTTTGQLFYQTKERKEKKWQQIIKPNNLYGAPMYTK